MAQEARLLKGWWDGRYWVERSVYHSEPTGAQQSRWEVPLQRMRRFGEERTWSSGKRNTSKGIQHVLLAGCIEERRNDAAMP